MTFENRKMRKRSERKFEFNATLALEKLYQNSGVEEDAFYFNLIEEELNEKQSRFWKSVGDKISRGIYRAFTLVWFSLYFVAANIVRVVR